MPMAHSNTKSRPMFYQNITD